MKVLQKRIFLVLFLIVFLIIFSSFLIFAENNQDNQVFVDDHGNLRLENDYVAIVVNQHTNSMGRFAVETTGGAPFK